MLFDPVFLLIFALLLLVSGAVSSLLFSARPDLSHVLAYGLAALASLSGLAATTLLLIRFQTLTLPSIPLTMLASFPLKLDPLSSLFAWLVFLVGFAVSVYAMGYARTYIGTKHVGALGATYNMFLLSLVLVPAADSALAFLFVWELMAVLSFFLVAYEHEHAQTQHASIFYVLMTQIGTGFLFASFFILASHAHDVSFDAFRLAWPTLPEWQRHLVFLGALIGFGTKSGLVPLHTWIPEAYPAAPSHASALMSGLMAKMGVYGLLRMVFDFLGGGVPWWGMLILILGGLSAVLGALFAIVESDLKRILAFSSIENMGVIWVGLGAGILFGALGSRELASLALIAALYHLLNHACFKSLLFCGAGAVLQATRTCDVDQLGGLIKRMPQTAFFFLFGTVAILALPPLNGFVSEWLIFQALLLGIFAEGPLLRLVMPLAGAAMVFAGGLAVVAFTKAFAIAFLAKPRSAAASSAMEVGLSMRSGMGLLAVACGLLALLPSTVIGLLEVICAPLLGGAHAASLSTSGLFVGTKLATLSTPGILGLLGTFLALAFLVPSLCGSRLGTRVAPTWGCGLTLSKRTQYTSQGFSQPIRAIFGRLLLPHTQEVQVKGWSSSYFKRDLRYTVYLEPIFERYLYGPIVRLVMFGARQASHLQTGSIHLYLGYILVALLLVLVFIKRLS